MNRFRAGLALSLEVIFQRKKKVSMTEPQVSTPALTPVSKEAVTAALLEITGDLDKAQVLQQTLPKWWLDAHTDTRQALETAHAQSHPVRERATRLLRRVKPLEQFCSEHLRRFLAAKGHAQLDVEHDQLELPKRTIIGMVSPDRPVLTRVEVERHSLLQAAMQNFSSARAQAGGLAPGAVIRTRQGAVAALGAETFAGYCRELDLGEAYQRHLREIFNLPVPGENVVVVGPGYNPALEDIGRARVSDMQIDLHIAFAKGDVSAPTYTLLQALIRADAPAAEVAHLLFQGKPLIWQGMNIDDACLWGVMVLAPAARSGFSSGPVVIYMPNEPVRPWFEYPSLEDFKVYLTLKLQVKTYRQFFTGYLDEAARVGFFQRFDRTRALGRLEPVLAFGNLSTFFFSSCTGKIQLDAIVLAVPTLMADEDARQKRLQDYEDLGLTVLNLASFVVPVLGELMMGVGIGQLLGEVFEGVEDWTHGDKTEALEHLVSVAQNLAFMAVFAAGGKALGAVKRTLLAPPEFFEGMEAVRLDDARPRLWRSRLRPYIHNLDVDALTVANDRGVYQVGRQSYAKVDDRLYAIGFDKQTDQWRAQHPLRATAYRPPLVHNRVGGWQFQFENPHDWHVRTYILKRLSPSLAALSEGNLLAITTIVDLSVPEMHLLARQNLALPERFRDCVVRFRQNQKVRDLAWQLEHMQQPKVETARTQMLTLPLMPGWPKGRFFEVLDSEGGLMERHPETSPFDYEDLSIHITEQQLADGQVLETLLVSLDAEETQALLGAEVEPGEALAVLKRRLLTSLNRNPRQAYEQLYQDVDVTTHDDHGLLRAAFPQLPDRLAWELLAKTPTVQRWQLRNTGRVPLALAQRTRNQLQILEEDHAVMGLYLPELASEASQRLALGLMAQLEGWPRTLALQVRKGTLGGGRVAAIGPSGPVSRTVLETAEGFQAYDGQGQVLSELREGGNAFYQAVIDSLSTQERATLRLSKVGQASHLRYSVQGKVESQRKEVARYLWPERVMPQRMGGCIPALLADPALPSQALARKVRKLFPLFDTRQVTAFLHARGSDHLSQAKAVQALEQQFEALHRALKQWSREKPSPLPSAHHEADYRMSRRHAARAIEQGWKQMALLPNEQGEKVPSLVLDGMRVGRLPTLPPQVAFGQIRQLSLNVMDLDDDVAYFLKHFKDLKTLHLQDNRVTRLPEALSLMPNLERLYLDRNQLQLTDHTLTKLGGLEHLRTLSLNNNPLATPPLTLRQFELRELGLRNCRLSEVPAGLWRLPYLERVDMRDNDIRALPGWLANLPRQSGDAFNFRNNPLNAVSQQLLRTYRTNTGIGMGYLEDDIARLNELKAQELWLANGLDAQSVARRQTWTAIKDERGSDALFKLLAELGGTADTQQVREDMHRRVWTVLEAAAGDESLRTEVFERAATPRNCDDAAAVNFSNLEVLVEIREASKLVAGGQLTAQPLLRLAKGLFRLEQLEHYARRHSDEHPAADPLEVSLAYRTGLVNRFHLPGQPMHMRFSRLGGVTAQALNVAENRLKADELSPKLLAYLIKLPFWHDYLKKTYKERFEALNSSFDERLAEVFDQSLTLNDVEYRDQMNQILDEQRVAETIELERLTTLALQQDEQVCAVPLG